MKATARAPHTLHKQFEANRLVGKFCFGWNLVMQPLVSPRCNVRSMRKHRFALYSQVFSNLASLNTYWADCPVPPTCQIEPKWKKIWVRTKSSFSHRPHIAAGAGQRFHNQVLIEVELCYEPICFKLHRKRFGTHFGRSNLTISENAELK